MAMTEPTKKNKSPVVRFTLDNHSMEILAGWRQKLSGAFPQLEFSDSDLIRWAISRTPILSKNNLRELKSAVFDEVKALENILKTLKQAKASGDHETVTTAMQNVALLVRSERPYSTKRNLNPIDDKSDEK
jgi:fructose-1-phosphate kinase PfkB-like protein